MCMYRYTFELKQKITSCSNCELTDDGGSCLLLTRAYKTMLEQFKHCPLIETVTEELPFMAFSTPEISYTGVLGEGCIVCRVCGETHELQYGRCADGNLNKDIAYTVCANGRLQLVGVRGKKIN